MNRRSRERPGPRRNPEKLLLDSLRNRWSDFRRRLFLCRKEPTEPAVHDLRVAIRRFTASLDLLSAVAPSTALDGVRRQLRRQLKRMGRLRDTQVQMLSAQKLSKEFRGLDPFATVLVLRERRALVRVVRRLEAVQLRGIQRPVVSSIRGLERSMGRPGVAAGVRSALEGSLASSYLRVVVLRRQIRSTDPVTIHRFRIAFKKFRYTTEILRPGIEKSCHKAMNDLQTRMGEIHDLGVLNESLHGYRLNRLVHVEARTGSVLAARLTALERRLRRRRATRIRQFMRSVDGFHRFYVPDRATS